MSRGHVKEIWTRKVYKVMVYREYYLILSHQNNRQ